MWSRIKNFRIKRRTRDIIIGVALVITLLAWLGGGLWVMTQ